MEVPQPGPMLPNTPWSITSVQPLAESAKFPPQSEEVVTFCIVEPHDYLSIYFHFFKVFLKVFIEEPLPIAFEGE